MDEQPSPYDPPAERPLPWLREWLAQARAAELPEPAAVALATADAQGRASNRIIQILEVSAEGLVFATHRDSPKGLDIQATGWASAVFHWPVLKRQIIVAGTIQPLDEAHTDRLWAARPRSALAMSLASRQSAPLQDEAALLQQAQALEATAGALPRPPHWVGLLLRAEQVEFWQFSPDRLYKRLQYQRQDDDRWSSRRLQP